MAATAGAQQLANAEAPEIGQSSVLNLPDMGEPADLAISPAEESEVSLEIVHELYAAEYVMEDREVTDYLSGLGWKLASVGSPNPPPFQFFLIRDPRINAFALPGGEIAFNAGTIINSQAESEMAAVLAHEEAHVTQRHIAREANRTQVADIATLLASLAAIIAGSANPNVIIGALTLGQGINYNRDISYTRDNEMEADRIGIRTLAAAGFNPQSMADFFERLDQQTRLYGGSLPELLQSHPVNTTRIAEADERAAQYAKRTYTDAVEYGLMRARTRVAIADQPNFAAAYFRDQIAAGRGSPENRYGYAYALSLMSQGAAAEEALKPVLTALPHQLNVSLLQAQILLDTGHPRESLDLYAKMMDSYPRSPAAVLEAADAQTQAGHPEAARQLLIAHRDVLDQTIDTQIALYRQLADNARALNNTAEAQYETANLLFVRGEARGAIEQIDAALRLSSLAPDDRARLLARRREIIASLPREQLRGG